MTDATETLTRSAIFARMADDPTLTNFQRFLSRESYDMAHLRECDGCAHGVLAAYQTYGIAEGFLPREPQAAFFERLERNYAQMPDWVDTLQAAQEPAPLVVPEDVDAEIRENFPGAIADDKLAKLRALIVENRELKRKLESDIDLNDTRLWPAFGRVAVAADAAGYCNEYDRMSEAGGFPTRDELREAGMLPTPQWTGQVILDVTYTITERVRLNVGPIEARTYDDAVDEIQENADELVTDEAILQASDYSIPSNAEVEWELDYVNSVDRV
jgi:hypothetical protein